MNEELIKSHGIDLLDLVEETSRVYVWKAVQRTLDRLVFLVILKEEPANDPLETSYFLMVARQFAKLKCESLAAIFDVVSEENLHYAIMEYIDGDSLDKTVASGGPLTLNQVLQIGTSVCGCLKQLWENSEVIHRNIKGSTIRFDSRGIAKLMDFSLAILKTPDFDPNVIDKDHLHGTPSFISPELANGGLDFSIQSDMYALGILLYYSSTGKIPFSELTAEDILMQQIGGILPPPHHINSNLPVNFSRLVHKLLMKSPANRYQNWDEVHHDLHCLMDNRQPVCATVNVNFASTIIPDFSETSSPDDNQPPSIKIKTKKRNKYLEDIQHKHVQHHHTADEKGRMIRLQLIWWGILGVWLAGLFWFRAVIQVDPQSKQQLLDKGRQIGANLENIIAAKQDNNADIQQSDKAQQPVAVINRNDSNGETPESVKPSLPLPAILVDKLAEQFKKGDIATAIEIASDRNIVFAGKQELLNALNSIPAADKLVSQHLLNNIGNPLVMNFKGKQRKVIPRKVLNNVVTLEANGRTIDFKITDLSTEQKSNWVDPPGTEKEHITFCLLLLQTWRAAEAGNYADQCGILAPVIAKAASL